MERTFFRTEVTTIFNFTNNIIRSTFFCNHGNQAIVDENSGSGHQNFGNIFVVNPKDVFGTFLLVLIIGDNFDGGTYFSKKKMRFADSGLVNSGNVVRSHELATHENSSRR